MKTMQATMVDCGEGAGMDSAFIAEIQLTVQKLWEKQTTSVL
jgi:hypothetical protein